MTSLNSRFIRGHCERQRSRSASISRPRGNLMGLPRRSAPRNDIFLLTFSLVKGASIHTNKGG